MHLQLEFLQSSMLFFRPYTHSSSDQVCFLYLPLKTHTSSPQMKPPTVLCAPLVNISPKGIQLFT